MQTDAKYVECGIFYQSFQVPDVPKSDPGDRFLILP